MYQHILVMGDMGRKTCFLVSISRLNDRKCCLFIYTHQNFVTNLKYFNAILRQTSENSVALIREEFYFVFYLKTTNFFIRRITGIWHSENVVLSL